MELPWKVLPAPVLQEPLALREVPVPQEVPGSPMGPMLPRDLAAAQPMGLPVPLMGLFNLLQFGTIGEEEQTIAEIVQGMYFEGYDFIHFCSMSLPVMLTEVIVRIGYAYKRIREGNKIKESIPFSTDRDRHPKLATMLFLAHSGAAAINAGKIYFTKNPMAINYPQWIAFAKYSYMQLKWILLKKPKAREDYILGKIDQELFEAYRQTDAVFDEFSNDHRLLFG